MTNKVQNVTELNADALEAIMAAEILADAEINVEIQSDPELEAALNEGFEPELEPNLSPATDPGYADEATEDMIVLDIVQATAQANGADEALMKAADEAVEEEKTEDDAPVDPAMSFLEARDAVTMEQVTKMQTDLTAAFAERANYERQMNPANDNIQKTLTKVQKGHLAHAISQGFVAAGVDPNYLNKSEVSGKRRNVYALAKLQDLIYGASSGHLKNAINIAVLVSMVKLERAQVAFTGAVALACASDKIAVEAHLKGLLRRHTVAESTASTQSSSTMTALEDLGAVVNHGTQKHPRWTFSDTMLARRLREVAETKHMPVTV